MDHLVERLKALGDGNRFRIAMMLTERPLCACELLTVLDIAGGTLSAHLKVLRSAGLIEQRRDGRWIEWFPAENTRDLLIELRDRVEDKRQLFEDLAAIRGVDRSVCSTMKA